MIGATANFVKGLCMKRIIIATAQPEPELLRLTAFMLMGAGFNAKITEFNNFYKDEDCDVLLSNYILLTTGKPTFEMLGKADAVFVFDCSEKDKLVEKWVGTPHLRIAKNQDMLLKLIVNASKDYGLEIERKFLIEYPDLSYLNSLKNARAVNMKQVYLKRGENGESMRVRKRYEDGCAMYVKTVKQKISDTVRIETEFDISESDYKNELENADSALKPIVKTRYHIMYKDIYYELDVFPFWQKQAYLEVELENENDSIELPPFIKIIKEVTKDKRYTNHSLAGCIPDED